MAAQPGKSSISRQWAILAWCLSYLVATGQGQEQVPSIRSSTPTQGQTDGGQWCLSFCAGQPRPCPDDSDQHQQCPQSRNESSFHRGADCGKKGSVGCLPRRHQSRLGAGIPTTREGHGPHARRACHSGSLPRYSKSRTTRCSPSSRSWADRQPGAGRLRWYMVHYDAAMATREHLQRSRSNSSQSDDSRCRRPLGTDGCVPSSATMWAAPRFRRTTIFEQLGQHLWSLSTQLVVRPAQQMQNCMPQRTIFRMLACPDRLQPTLESLLQSLIRCPLGTVSHLPQGHSPRREWHTLPRELHPMQPTVQQSRNHPGLQSMSMLLRTSWLPGGYWSHLVDGIPTLALSDRSIQTRDPFKPSSQRRRTTIFKRFLRKTIRDKGVHDICARCLTWKLQFGLCFRQPTEAMSFV